MNRLDELQNQLKAEVEGIAISPAVETALLKEFDKKWGRGFRPAAGLPPGVYIAATMLLAACLILVLWPKSKPSHQPPVIAAAATAPATSVQLTAATKFKPRRHHKPAKQAAPEPEFLRIPYTSPLAPYERTEIVRVDLPVSALAAAGLRIDTADTAARAQADLIVGQDGMARAVRLISISSTEFKRSNNDE